MNITLVSQCSGRAINETQRVLDQFAERKGNRTWQTSITQAGLVTLRKLLKQTARRNTAVACHWTRGLNRTELIWIVGNASRFNEEGTVPTNVTSRDVLRKSSENQWQHGQIIRLAAGIAALFHDFGKASLLFQNKLRSTSKPPADPYRHEWVSLVLFQAMIHHCKTDEEWLTHLAQLNQANEDDWQNNIDQYNDSVSQDKNKPLKHLPPFAQLVGWLILSHHYLPSPVNNEDRKSGFNHRRLGNALNMLSVEWNSYSDKSDEKRVKQNWTFKHGIPSNSQKWINQANYLASKALSLPSLAEAHLVNTPFTSHISRLCLMWADHYYSSLPANHSRGDKNYRLYANTDRDPRSENHGGMKQQLDEHLLGVAHFSSRLSYSLPLLQKQLPRVARLKALTKRSTDARFRWQDKAYDLSKSLKQRSEDHGFFGVNMASTGRGKTFANARIMYGLSNPQVGARFTVALGLRTLTLQTGDAYRDMLQVGSDDLAVLTGGAAVRQLHERKQAEHKATAADQSGSESANQLFELDHHVHYDGVITNGAFNQYLQQEPRLQKLLNAPLLCCTIDHLMPAVEGVRGGKQIVPMLRLLTSDLVLDEPDDFGLEDTHALARLVYFAGLLGSRVLLSSATLPPALIRGLFDAYLAGREGYQKSCGNPGTSLNVQCAWFDEYNASEVQASSADFFEQHHNQFIEKRLSKLSQHSPRVNAEIAELPLSPIVKDEELYPPFAEFLIQQAKQLHSNNHNKCPHSGKQVSFGLLRMANIGPLYETCKALYGVGSGDTQIHLCCYHSRHPLIVRSEMEGMLDKALNRKNPKAVFDLPEIHSSIYASDKQHHVFLVAATAVAEVGRDHDYDWAIVEPSSMRSIIQLAGRVRRHRPEPYAVNNILLLDTNTRQLRSGDERPAYCMPGFETSEMKLNHHTVTKLLRKDQYQPLDATSRISEADELEPNDNLVDLEHHRMRSQMGQDSENREINSTRFWNTPASVTGVFQKDTKFRDGMPSGTYVLIPDGDEVKLNFQERDGSYSHQTSLLKVDADWPDKRHAESWATADYLTALRSLADERDEDVEECTKRFGTLDMVPPENAGQGWKYHPWLGLTKNQ